MKITILEFLAKHVPDANDTVLDLIDRAGIADKPVVWNSRLKTSAGRAKFMHGVLECIEMNVKLMVEGSIIGGDKEALAKTFLHEVAHGICGHAAGHNAAFKRTLRRIGGDGQRCHEYLTMQRTSRPKKPIASCTKCGFIWMRATRMARNRSYTHRNCGGEFDPLG